MSPAALIITALIISTILATIGSIMIMVAKVAMSEHVEDKNFGKQVCTVIGLTFFGTFLILVAIAITVNEILTLLPK